VVIPPANPDTGLMSGLTSPRSVAELLALGRPVKYLHFW
jgi:hypothetical protein